MPLLAGKVKQKCPISTGICGVSPEIACFSWFLTVFALRRLALRAFEHLRLARYHEFKARAN